MIMNGMIVVMFTQKPCFIQKTVPFFIGVHACCSGSLLPSSDLWLHFLQECVVSFLISCLVLLYVVT
jgi:hypothetical protein